jgi:hypothetical protein
MLSIEEKELEFYTRPFHKYYSRISDKKSNFVFQFETRFDSKGDYAEGELELQDKVLDSLNSKEHKPIPELNLIVQPIDPISIYNGDRPFITIRGWGNLTGVGAHNFHPEKATKIQDNFRDWLIYKLTIKN